MCALRLDARAFMPPRGRDDFRRLHVAPRSSPPRGELGRPETPIVGTSTPPCTLMSFEGGECIALPRHGLDARVGGAAVQHGSLPVAPVGTIFRRQPLARARTVERPASPRGPFERTTWRFQDASPRRSPSAPSCALTRNEEAGRATNVQSHRHARRRAAGRTAQRQARDALCRRDVESADALVSSSEHKAVRLSGLERCIFLPRGSFSRRRKRQHQSDGAEKTPPARSLKGRRSALRRGKRTLKRHKNLSVSSRWLSFLLYCLLWCARLPTGTRSTSTPAPSPHVATWVDNRPTSGENRIPHPRDFDSYGVHSHAASPLGGQLWFMGRGGLAEGRTTGRAKTQSRGLQSRSRTKQTDMQCVWESKGRKE